MVASIPKKACFGGSDLEHSDDCLQSVLSTSFPGVSDLSGQPAIESWQCFAAGNDPDSG